MKPRTDHAIKQSGYFDKTPSARALQRLGALQKLSVHSASKFADSIEKAMEREKTLEEEDNVKDNLAFI